MRHWQDIGFRDQREVDCYYGRCPDCGDYPASRCSCKTPPPEPPPPTPEQVAAYERIKEEYGDLPF